MSVSKWVSCWMIVHIHSLAAALRWPRSRTRTHALALSLVRSLLPLLLYAEPHHTHKDDMEFW